MGRARAARVTPLSSATFVFYLATPTFSNSPSTCNQRDVLILQPLPVARPKFSFSPLLSFIPPWFNKKNKCCLQSPSAQTPKQWVAVEHMDVVALYLKNAKKPWRAEATRQIFFFWTCLTEVVQVARSRRSRCPLHLKLVRWVLSCWRCEDCSAADSEGNTAVSIWKNQSSLGAVHWLGMKNHLSLSFSHSGGGGRVGHDAGTDSWPLGGGGLPAQPRPAGGHLGHHAHRSAQVGRLPPAGHHVVPAALPGPAGQEAAGHQDRGRWGDTLRRGGREKRMDERKEGGVRWESFKICAVRSSALLRWPEMMMSSLSHVIIELTRSVENSIASLSRSVWNKRDRKGFCWELCFTSKLHTLWTRRCKDFSFWVVSLPRFSPS